MKKITILEILLMAIAIEINAQSNIGNETSIIKYAGEKIMELYQTSLTAKRGWDWHMGCSSFAERRNTIGKECTFHPRVMP